MIDEKALKAVAEAIAAERVKQFGAAAGLAPREAEFEYARVAILAYESAKPKEAAGQPVAWAEEYGGKVVSVALKEGAFHKTPLYRAMLSAAGGKE